MVWCVVCVVRCVVWCGVVWCVCGVCVCGVCVWCVCVWCVCGVCVVCVCVWCVCGVWGVWVWCVVRGAWCVVWCTPPYPVPHTNNVLFRPLFDVGETTVGPQPVPDRLQPLLGPEHLKHKLLTSKQNMLSSTRDGGREGGGHKKCSLLDNAERNEGVHGVAPCTAPLCVHLLIQSLTQPCCNNVLFSPLFDVGETTAGPQPVLDRPQPYPKGVTRGPSPTAFPGASWAGLFGPLPCLPVSWTPGKP